MRTFDLKIIIIIFVAAFILNAVWENLHSFLYIGYKGGEITEFILLRASLWDAVMISAMALPLVIFPALKKHGWAIIVFGIILSLGIEWWALSTDRWAYNDYMPIIPLLSVGLTPVIQLGLLGYISFKIAYLKVVDTGRYAPGKFLL